MGSVRGTSVSGDVNWGSIHWPTMRFLLFSKIPLYVTCAAALSIITESCLISTVLSGIPWIPLLGTSMFPVRFPTLSLKMLNTTSGVASPMVTLPIQELGVVKEFGFWVHPIRVRIERRRIANFMLVFLHKTLCFVNCYFGCVFIRIREIYHGYWCWQ